MKHRIIRNCDKCDKEDSINCISGLCVSCESKRADKDLSLILNPKETEQEVYNRKQEEILKGVFE